MRATVLAFVSLLASCAADDTVAKDTSYRRLLDGYTSVDQCLAKNVVSACYQTLVLCPDGTVMLDLMNDQQDGTYHLDGKRAIASFVTRTVEFDLGTASSPQLPGDNAWELVNPTFTGCSH